MIEPVLADDALLADISAAADDPQKVHLWWLGQSGFLLHWRGTHLLLDPYLSESLTTKYAGTDKPHVRMTRRCVDPAKLNFVDVVTSSHNHTDHLDAETLRPMLAANPRMTLVIPEANRTFVANRLQIPAGLPVGLDCGRSAEIQGLQIYGVAAAHELLERDADGRHVYLGYVIRIGPLTVYHSGDTLRYPGMAETLRGFDIDLAILPINGRAPERRVAGNLDGPEAARLAQDIGAKQVVPCHYEMFEFNTVSPEAFEREAQRIGQAFKTLRCGERLEL